MEAEADYGDGYYWAEDGDDYENIVCCDDAWASAEWPIVLCDGCDQAWHLASLDPPLDAVPAGDWYCSRCWAEWERGW